MSDKFYLCKYQIGTLAFMMGEENIIIDHSNVMAIEYLNDYENNLRAILKLQLRLDIRKKLWILKNKANIVVKFELDKIGIDTDMYEYVTSPEIVWDEIFSLYFDDADDVTDVKALEERLAMNESEDFVVNDISSENYYESQNFLSVYLFNQELLNASANQFNCVFTENNIQQFVGRLLSNTKHKNVLMSRFENDEIYKELLIPSNQAYKALIYMDQYFGFYKTGAIIYYDVDKLYILNSNGKATAKQEGEYVETVILVTQLEQSVPGNGMVRKEGEMVNYVTIPEQGIKPRKMSETKNAEYGSNVKMVKSDDIDIESTEANQSFVDQRNENVTYTRKGHNKFAAEIMKARMEENEIHLYISGNNFDITAFTPNKTFQVVFDEPLKQQTYGGYKYRISYAYHFIKIESDSFMTASHHITLKKAANQE